MKENPPMVTAEDIKGYYERQYSERGESACRPSRAFGIFLDHLDVKPGGRILDVGCGTGTLLEEAERRGLEGYGVDISEEAVAIARSKAPASTVSTGSAEELAFPDGFFDYVTCIGVLEHLVDMGRGVREFLRVLKEDGRMCIVVPNRNYLYWMLTRHWGTEQQEINEHLMSLDEWQRLFSGCGLTVRAVEQDTEWFRKKERVFESRNPLRAARILLRKLKWSLLPLRYTYQFVFILEQGD